MMEITEYRQIKCNFLHNSEHPSKNCQERCPAAIQELITTHSDSNILYSMLVL